MSEFHGEDPGREDAGTARTANPLARHVRMRTRDLDEVRDKVARALCPHRIRLDGRDGLDAEFSAARLDQTALHYLSYGAAVHVRGERHPEAFLVGVPVAGEGELATLGHRAAVEPGRGFVLSPDEPFALRFGGSYRQLVLRLERPFLEEVLAELTGEPAHAPLRFTPGFRLGGGAARRWMRTFHALREELDHGAAPGLDHGAAPGGDGGPCPAPGGGPDPVVGHLERACAAGLLLAAEHNHSALLRRGAPPVRPREVRRAQEFIEAHAAADVTTEAVAREVALSVRALQKGFRDHLGTTPTGYLRQVRLRRAHEELLTADPAATTVTEVAARWGFGHPGRFSLAYRERFGAPPSRTLRAAPPSRTPRGGPR